MLFDNAVVEERVANEQRSFIVHSVLGPRRPGGVNVSIAFLENSVRAKRRINLCYKKPPAMHGWATWDVDLSSGGGIHEDTHPGHAVKHGGVPSWWAGVGGGDKVAKLVRAHGGCLGARRR